MFGIRKKTTDNLASLSNLQAEVAVKKLLKEVSVKKTPKFDLDSRHAIYTLAKQYNSKEQFHTSWNGDTAKSNPALQNILALGTNKSNP